MNTRTKSILMAAALAAATSALSSQAADQSAYLEKQNAYFEQQRQLTDGYSPPFNVVPTARSLKPATPYQIEENKWLTAERARGLGTLPTPFPVPETSVATKARPTTLSQVAHDKSWQQERDEDDGYASPTQFPN
jgi:hypothetical protein